MGEEKNTHRNEIESADTNHLSPKRRSRKEADDIPSWEKGWRRKRRKKAMRRGFFCLFLLLLAAAGTAFDIFYVNEFTFTVMPAGDAQMYLEYGTPYEEPGVVATLRGSHVFRNGITLEDLEVRTQGTVDELATGKYELTYFVSYRWFAGETSRSVRVVDSQAPVITLKGDPDLVVARGKQYVEEGYSAWDNCDGDVTDKVVVYREGKNYRYVVMDSSGNPISVVREVNYDDPDSPVLTLKGETFIRILAGRVYREPGYSASDLVEGDMTERVAVKGEVLWYVPGSYTITYTATDSYGNKATAARTVEVEGVPWPKISFPGEKTIYLTFEDGPGPYTKEILEVLDRYDVNATFFVCDTGNYDMMQSIVNRGHSIGIHGANHEYNRIYASEEAFFEELFRMQDLIKEHTGVTTTLLRFPGGSGNQVSRFNEGIMTTLTKAVQHAGFQYFDWNVDSQDAGDSRLPEVILENVKRGVGQRRVSMVLMHDTHDYTPEAVEQILIWGLENGYSFRALNPISSAIRQDVVN